MPYNAPGQLAYESLAHGPASRAARAAELLADAWRENRRAGDRWLLRLITAAVAAHAGIALVQETLPPSAAVLTALGIAITFATRLGWRTRRRGAIALGLATHFIAWGISVQIGSRVEWGALFFVLTTMQLRYEDASVILPSIACYLLQHVLQFVLLTLGVSLDFLWRGDFNLTASLLATSLAIAQGFVIVEIARALTLRNETAVLAHVDLAQRAAQSTAQALEVQRTEAIMRGVIGGSEDGVAVYDADERILIWNPKMETITGVRAAMAIGRHRADVHGSDSARTDALRSALGGVPAHVNNVSFFDAAAGRRSTFDIAYIPLRDTAGSVIGAFKVAHDVSERIRAADAIASTRQQLLEALETIDAGFALFDADDRVIQVNSAYRAYYKEIEATLTPGTPYVEIARAYLTVFPEYAAGLPIDEAVRSWVAARSERTNTKEYQQGDRWLLLQDRPTASGGRVSLRTNITNLKTIQRELEEARVKAEEANRAKSEFLARMSHELRTPLNSIIGFSRLVKANKQGTLAPKDITYLDRVSGNGEHLLSLINSILDLSRIEAGKMPLVIEEIDCNAMVLDTVRMLEDQTAHGPVRLVSHISPKQLNISTDAAKLRQVLINLIGNALKFTTHGSVTIRVDQHPEFRDRVVFSVADTGIGIPADRLNTIFDAFEQADGTTSRQYGGTGLGLTISRTLCDLIHATLTVESQTGVGSTFRVTCAPMTRRPTPMAARGSVETMTVSTGADRQ